MSNCHKRNKRTRINLSRSFKRNKRSCSCQRILPVLSCPPEEEEEKVEVEVEGEEEAVLEEVREVWDEEEVLHHHWILRKVHCSNTLQHHHLPLHLKDKHLSNSRQCKVKNLQLVWRPHNQDNNNLLLVQYRLIKAKSMGKNLLYNNSQAKLHLSYKGQNHLSNHKQVPHSNSKLGRLDNHNKRDSHRNSKVLECLNNSKDRVHKDLNNKGLDHKGHNNKEPDHKGHNNKEFVHKELHSKELVHKELHSKEHALKDLNKELVLKDLLNKEHLDHNSQVSPKGFDQLSHRLLLLLNNKPKYLNNSLNQVLHLREFKVLSQHKDNLGEASNQLEEDNHRLKLEGVNLNLKQEEDNHKPRQEEDSPKPKQAEDNRKPKLVEVNHKPKREEANHRPKREGDSHKLKQVEDSHKPKLEEDSHKPKQEEDSLRPKQAEGNHKPKQDAASLLEEDNLLEEDSLLVEVNQLVEELLRKERKDSNSKANLVLLIQWVPCLVVIPWQPLERLETLESKWAASSKDLDSNQNYTLTYFSIDTHCIAAICAVSLL